MFYILLYKYEQDNVNVNVSMAWPGWANYIHNNLK